MAALWAIIKASFKGILVHPGAIFFSILFPVIFVLIFGAFGTGSQVRFRVALSPGSDTANVFFQYLKNNEAIRIVSYQDSAVQRKDLLKGTLTGVLYVEEAKDSLRQIFYKLYIRSTTASMNTLGALMQVLDYSRLQFESAVSASRQQIVVIEPPQVEQVRKYRQIDFILPGQLGFSILFSTLFGIAFTFYTLREQLVLKRFYVTPVKKINILVGIGISRLFFQLLSVVVLLLFGHLVLHFTLQNGLLTFLQIIGLTVLMLFFLLAVGLIFSSLARSDTSIPLMINLFGFPQMLLSGTFFPIEVFPKWLQAACRVLPLTQYNEAARKISFEGQTIFACGKELGILAVWMIAAYAILFRVMKWE